MREVWGIEAEQKPYHPSQLTRFRNRIGMERLERIMNRIVEELLEGEVINGETVVMDATFIKAHRERDPHENSLESSDPDARVGRNGKIYEIGYKVHVAADSKSELPLALIAAPTNENEKKHASGLFDKALKTTKQRMNTLVADSQYSSRKLRDKISACGVRAVIPYPTNQRRREKRLLRVDKYFRTHCPTCERRIYRAKGSGRANEFKTEGAAGPQQAQGQKPQKNHDRRLTLHNRHAPHSVGGIKTETSGKSQIHNPTQKVSRN